MSLEARRRRRRHAAPRGRRLLPALAALVLLAGPAAAARADGDPASDYLVVQSTFLSPGSGAAPSADASLIALVGQAQKDGLPLKVAVIVQPYDLGAVPELFDKPQEYAYFLSSEDVYYWQDELITVMPTGYGVYKTALHGGVPSNATPPADRAALDAVAFHKTSSATALVVAAETAVRALAARHGIHLSAASAAAVKPTGLSSSWVERIEIIAGVVAVLLLGLALRVGRARLRSR